MPEKATAAASAAHPTEQGLNCMKCLEPTLIKDSLPNGRNALRRNCLDCCSTDKWLQRMVKKPKSGETESEASKEKREKAEALKAQVSKMTPAERAAWYVKQKEERKRQERTSKRTFSTGVGYANEENQSFLESGDRDIFETEEDWCARQLTLGLFPNFEAAKAGFRQECLKPGSKTMERRGETLLQRFTGFAVNSGNRHSLTTGVRQRADITDEDDLATFRAEAADRVDKGSWRLESDRNAMLENTLKKPTELLNVQADLQKAKQVEQELEQMWMEQLESEATAKQTAAKKVTVKSAGVEAMGFQAAIDRTTQSMFDLLARQQALILQAQEDGSLLETELLRKECEEKQEECQALVPEVVSSIEELKKEWIDKKTKAELTKNAEQLHTDAGQVAKEFKTWNAQDEAWVKLKGKVKDWKAWLCKTQAQTKKAEKAGAQARAAANNKVGNATSWFDLPLCKQAVQDLKDSNFDGFEDKGNGWNLGRDMLDCEDAAEVTPVVFTATQGLPYASDMKGFDYFKFQKVWVAEQMKKSGGATWLSALCTKSTVSKKLAGYWSKLLGPECEKFVREFPEVSRELFQPQFYQQDENSCAVHLLPDFGMADVRISLEGSCYLMGFPLQKMGGKDLASKRETLQRQSWATFKHMCTWAVHLQEGKVVAIPGDHVFCSVTCEEHHGGRIHALCQGHAKRTMDMTKLLMRDNGLLAGLKTGKLHDTLQSLVSAAAAGASASSGQEDQKMGEEDGDEEVAEPQPKRARAESAKAPKKTAKPKAGKQ